MSAMRILQVAYPLAPVHPEAVGGAEQIVSMLDRSLVRERYDSWVVATADSEVSGKLIPLEPISESELREFEREHYYARCFDTIRRTLECWRFDLVHVHGFDFHRYLPPTPIPTIATLHLPLSWYPPQVFCMNIKRICVSESQRVLFRDSQAIESVIRNGIWIHDFHLARTKLPFVLCLGRVCPEKGFHLAFNAAEKLGIEIILAGDVFPYSSHIKYFEEEIARRLSPKIHFLGPIGGKQKRRLLAQAQCVLVPSLVPETCSLVALEALASGTPVVAFRRGALEEIVVHGETGFLIDHEDEMADAIERTKNLNPEACRKMAEKHYSCDRMFREYLMLYEKFQRESVKVAAA